MANFVEPNSNKATVIFSLLTFLAIVGYIGFTLYQSNLAPDDSAADVVDGSPTPTVFVASATPTSRPTNTPRPTATPSVTPSPTLTPTVTPSITLTPTITPTPGAVICGNMDVNNDGKLTLIDFNSFGLLYGMSCSDTPATSTCGPKDSNGNHVLDLADLYSFTSRYLLPSCAI